MYLDEHFDLISSLPSSKEREQYLADLASREPQTAEKLGMLVRVPSTSFSSWASSVGSVIAGKYRLTELLGRGSSGDVWKAEAVSGLPVVYALKLFPTSGYDAANVVAEAETVVQLEDPRILKVFDYGQDGDGGPPYIVMEFIAGQSLDKAAPLEASTAVELMIDTCIAVAAAHRKNVLHRDLKPHNLIHTTDGRLKVVDFGIALRGTVPNASAGSPITDTMSMSLGAGRVVGTPAYVAPEILEGAPATERSDIYSLGATFFHLLAGRPPYRAREGSQIPWLDIVDQVLDEKTALLPKLPGLRRRLDRIIRRAMARDPKDRYTSVDQMRRDLELYRNKLPTLADGKNLLARFELFGERRKGLLLLASFLLLICLVAGQLVIMVRGLEEATRASVSAKVELEAALEREQRERLLAEKARDEQASRVEALNKSNAQLTRALALEKTAGAARDNKHEESSAHVLALNQKLSEEKAALEAETAALAQKLAAEKMRSVEKDQARATLSTRVKELETELSKLREQRKIVEAEATEAERRRLEMQEDKYRFARRKIAVSASDWLKQ
jgi:hypothetical protein